MPRLLSYADAVTVLGGQNSRVVSLLDAVTGGILLGAVPAVPAVVGWIDAKAEFVKLSHELVRDLSERRSGLARYTRTQRLHAAHTVIVVTGFFEALAHAELPFRFEDLELTRQEQLSLAGGSLTPLSASVVQVGLSDTVPFPEPDESHERFEDRLADYYEDFAVAVFEFIEGLAVGSVLATIGPQQFDRVIDATATAALRRYRQSVRRLAGDFPEVAWWTHLREHHATRTEVRAVGRALAGVERMLTAVTTGRVPDERRTALARTYRAALVRSIVESGTTPPGIVLPTLQDGYVEPQFRVATVEPGTRVSDQEWWEHLPLRDDLEGFLTGYLTAPRAVLAPLLVLGQPGSGKSVLTKVLAARLPACDFLPVRVVLREVSANAGLQDQIEQAIRDATGERLQWPQFARSADDALPVVILDGFDELLQATGTSQSDYLLKVARFQQREADQGRAVAMIVTSRTSVSDRATPPEGTVALRLEPFDDLRVVSWLTRWNTTNAAHFANSGLSPLPPAAVLTHRDLAGQPLLLLMLALYDAPGNALQNTVGDLGQGDLYGRLLHDFCIREVVRQHPGLGERDLAGAVEDELRRLSILSFGMFNRGNQWITETELDADLTALCGPPPPPHERTPVTRLADAEMLLGRFFFIHRAQASRDSTHLQTYEFLHATFGEFLVAHFTWLVLCDTVAQDRPSPPRVPMGSPVDLLHALLSFTPISVRAPIAGFLAELAAQVDDAERRALTRVLLRLFQDAHQPREALGFAGYQPRRRWGVPARRAAYSANLILLAVCVAGTVRASDLYPDEADDGQTDAIDRWHSEALLWRSQLGSGDWSSIVDTLDVRRVWRGDRRDLVLRLDDGTFVAPPTDLRWTYRQPLSTGRSPDLRGHRWSQHHPQVLRRKAHFQCGNLDDVAHHTLDPLSVRLPDTVNTVVDQDQAPMVSVAHLLLDLWLLPVGEVSSHQRRDAYQRCATVVVSTVSTWPPQTQRSIATLLLHRLTTDGEVPAPVVADVLERLQRAESPELAAALHVDIARCALAHLGRSSRADTRIARVLTQTLADRYDTGFDQMERPCAEAVVRGFEVGAEVESHRPWTAVAKHFAHRWPDLADRIYAQLAQESDDLGSIPSG